MGHTLVKLHDHYLVWSSIVDAPIQIFESLRDLKLWATRKYGSHYLELNYFDFEKLEMTGTSRKDHENAERTMRYNRAGPHEECLTIEGIYKFYCLELDFDKAWIVPEETEQ